MDSEQDHQSLLNQTFDMPSPSTIRKNLKENSTIKSTIKSHVSCYHGMSLDNLGDLLKQWEFEKDNEWHLFDDTTCMLLNIHLRILDNTWDTN